MRVPWYKVAAVVLAAAALYPIIRERGEHTDTVAIKTKASPTTTTTTPTHSTVVKPFDKLSYLWMVVAYVKAGEPEPEPEPEIQSEPYDTPSAPSTGYSADWDSIARCETGGNWQMQGHTYSGGVGFANTTWDGFGGREFAPNAGQATREQQIVVAERVYDRYGLSGWGCRDYG